jgi:hypothetical protein
MNVRDGNVTVDGKEYVLWTTYDSFEYADLETAIHISPKEDWDKIHEMHPDDADEIFYKFDMFEYNFEELKEIVSDWYNE